MSIVTLDPKVKQKLEQTLDAQIPGPDDEAFEGFAQSLRLAHPELHRELLQGIKVSAKMPVENAVKRAAWRSKLRETLNRLFYQKQWPDDLVLNKKRVMFAGLGTLMLLLPVAFLLSGNLIGSANEADAPTPQPTEEVTAVSETAQPSEQVEAFVSRPSSANDEPSSESVGSQGAAQTNNARTPIPPESLPETGTTPSSNRTFTPFPTTTPPQPTPTQVSSPFPSQSSEPALSAQLTVATSPPKSESITVWQNEDRDAAQGSDNMLGGLPSSLGSSATGIQSPTVFAQQAEQAPTPMVYTKDNVTAATALPMSVTTANLEGQASESSGTIQREDVSNQKRGRSNLSIYVQNDNAEPSPPVSPIVFSQNQPDMTSSPSTDVATEKTGSQPSVDAVSTAQKPAPESQASLQPGDRISAMLATGIVITDNASVPVVAETKGNWCGADSCPDVTWVGEATLAANNRVAIDFTQAVIGGELENVSGLALSNDTLPGLPTEPKDMTLAAAQDLLQSALGGVSDYVNALANQKRLVFQGDHIIQEGQAPGIESFILGRVASLFAPPKTQTSAVRVASIPAGTPLVVLYGVGTN